MAKQSKNTKTYTGKNVRLSEKAFEQIKQYVDLKGLKLGRFVEDAAIEKLQKQK